MSAKTQVVVLTGASSGIGRATALAFARDGAQLVLAARGREGLDSVADACAALGPRPMVVETDVTDAEAVQALCQAAIERFDHIDTWVNNVGVGAVGRFDHTPVHAHRRVIEANLLGHIHGAHAVVPHFRQRQRGVLVNMVSLGGFTPTPYATAYAASKFGLRGFSESLRAELSDLPRVHVCEVYPTFADTPGFAHGANFTGKQLKPPSPLLDPRTVADAVVALSRRPRRSVVIGSVAGPARLAHALAPHWVARTTYKLMQRAFRHADPARNTSGNLFAASAGHAVDGGFRATRSKPAAAAGLLLLAGACAVAGWMVFGKGGNSARRAR